MRNTLLLYLLAISSLFLTVHAQEPDPEFGYMISMAEAEDGELSGTQVASSTYGYSGSGYVTGLTSDNDYVKVMIDAPESGDYTVVIRYNNSSFKAQYVSINEASTFSVDFPAVMGWAHASAGDHYLEAGSNSVTISKNWGYSDIDRVELYPAPDRVFDVDPNPVDPDADPAAISMYEMLKLQFGTRIISGQTHSNFDQIKTITGRTPMLRAGDLSSYTEGYPYAWSSGHVFGIVPDGTPEDLISWHQETGNKGIVSLQWHWHAPIEETAGQNNFYTVNTDFDIRQAVTPGTPEYDATIRDIDAIATELQKFEDAGVSVLWRPLHEAGGGWFWWGAHGAEPCLALYDTLYNRLQNHHGLHNLIWVWSTPEEDWYPGNDKVDILGYDSYPGSYNYGNQKYAFNRIFDVSAGKKLLAMTENGPVPDPDACLDQDAPWLYFMSWDELVFEQNSESHLKEVYSHADVISIESENVRTGTEWRSSLYPEYWKPGYRDEQGRFLHDFSYAGYRGGDADIPYITENLVDVTAAPYLADSTGINDVTAIIQQAIDDVAASGGGVVYLPAGTYRIAAASAEDHALTISGNNVVLRGAGADSSYIFHDSNECRQKEVIYVAPAYASWFTSGGNETQIRHDLLLPTRAIPVNSIDGFTIGDKIIVRNSPTEAFIEEHGMTGMWNSNIKGVAHLRRIDSIDTVNRLLILDAPTRYELKTRDLARVYKAKAHLQEVGLEDFSIGNRESTKSGWGDNDYNVPGTGAYDSHFAQLIKFEYTENAWIKNVNSYRPGVNTLDIHMLSNGIQLNMCRHITIDSCIFQKPQYEGGGGNGYMFCLQSNDCLVSNCIANHSRHNYDFKYPFSNGNVIHRCRAENSRYSSDFHMFLSMSNLFDRTTVNGDYLESTFRPYGTTIHGHSSSQSVFYNTLGEQYHPSKNYIVDSRQYKWGYVIGTSGEATAVKTDPVAGTQGGYDYDTSPRDMVEGVGKGSDLRPLSLYKDQLERRKQDSVELHHFRVEFMVSNAETAQAVEGCLLEIYTQEQSTASDGKAVFDRVPESFMLELTDNRYLPVPAMHFVIYSDTLLYINLTESMFTLGFELLDESDLAPLNRVMITVGEQESITDSEGKTSFKVYSGRHDYSFEKYNYTPVSGSVELIEDTDLQVLVSRSHADVKFRLKEAGTPIYDAWVRVEDDSLQSSGIGVAAFPSLLVNLDYHYSVRKEGYSVKTGNFNLVENLTLEVEMEKVTGTSAMNLLSGQINLWPVPAKDILFADLPGIHLFERLQILDARGSIYMEKEITGDRVEISTSGLAAGLYLIRFTGTETAGMVFIKAE